MSDTEKLKLVDVKDREIKISHQCRLLDLRRNRVFYQPKGVSSKALEMMRILDELYLEDPTRGTRRMCHELLKRGFSIGRKYSSIDARDAFKNGLLPATNHGD